MTARVAMLWSANGYTTRRVNGDWPRAFVEGKWIYEYGINGQGQPNIIRGRLSGAEFLRYDIRREIGCDDVGELLALAPGVVDGSSTDGRLAGTPRSTRTPGTRPLGGIWDDHDRRAAKPVHNRPPVSAADTRDRARVRPARRRQTRRAR